MGISCNIEKSAKNAAGIVFYVTIYLRVFDPIYRFGIKMS